MITPEQLAEIAERQAERHAGIDSPIMNDVDLLIAECKRLHLALQAKDAVLAQFSDNENWETSYTDHRCGFEWVQVYNPIVLANQALNEGKE